MTWTPCTGDLAGLECGTVEVPLDHDRPHGQKIRSALTRLKHTVPADRYQGVLLLNPGGPGGSGLELPLWLAESPVSETFGPTT